MPRHVDASTAVEMEWRDMVQDREWWHCMEAGFVAKVLRKTPKLNLRHKCRCPCRIRLLRPPWNRAYAELSRIQGGASTDQSTRAEDRSCARSGKNGRLCRGSDPSQISPARVCPKGSTEGLARPWPFQRVVTGLAEADDVIHNLGYPNNAEVLSGGGGSSGPRPAASSTKSKRRKSVGCGA